MWIDSDAAGAGIWVKDTAVSPVIIPSANTDWLKYALSYNWFSPGEWLEVGIKYYDGATWTVVPLVTYTSDTGPMWDSVDISMYNGYTCIQIYFYYDDNNIWAGYAAFDNVMINGDTTGIIEETKDDITLKFGFAPNMPTLIKGHPAISYTTTTQGKVCLKIYNNTGRLIRTLVDNVIEPAGAKTVFWDGKDVAHRTVPNGVYFVGLKTEEKEATRKIVLIR